MTEEIERLEEGLFLLPGGYLDPGGECHREAKLRPLTGREEEWIADPALEWTEAVLVTALLHRTVERIGPYRPTEEMIRSLPVGDRDYLILKLRRITFGSRVELILTCPRPECARKMDIDFDLDSIPVERRPIRPFYTATLSDEAALTDDRGLPRREILFRIPNGGDQEAARGWFGIGPEAMFRRLLERALLEVGETGGRIAGQVSNLPERAMKEIAAAMERHSPQVQTELGARCPECGDEFTYDFEVAPFFLEEIFRGRARLEREVHLLGFYYHWPLREILRMTRRKRRRYLQLLTEELERSGRSVVGGV